MTIPSGGIPRTTNQILANLARTTVRRALTFHGQEISIKAIPLTLKLFTNLGFNPRFFREGAHICLMDKENYGRFSEACDIDAPGGFYPLSYNGDMDAVYREDAPFLPNRSRNIVLPEEHQSVSLVHEILHDIFFGGGLSAERRGEFTKELLFWYRLSVDPKVPHQHKNLPFYEGVAEACMGKYSLQDISPQYYRGRHSRERDFKIFAGECFAYAGESMRCPEDAVFKNSPRPIILFIRSHQVFNRRFINKASS